MCDFSLVTFGLTYQRKTTFVKCGFDYTTIFPNGKTITVKAHLIDYVYVSVCKTEMLTEGKKVLVEFFHLYFLRLHNLTELFEISAIKSKSAMKVYFLKT